MQWKNILAIINPSAGRWGSEKAAPRLLRETCAQHGTSITIRVVSGSQDARRWAQQAATEDFDLIVVCGGDGTMNETINGFADGRTLPIALLPTGSGNVLAGELGIPKKVADAIALIYSGTLRRVDAGFISTHQRFFLNAVTLGYGSRIIADTRQELKTLFGYPAYIMTALRKLIRLDTARFTCTIDDVPRAFDAQMVMVANIGFESMHLRRAGPDIRADDGLLDVVVFHHKDARDVVSFIAGFVIPALRPGIHLQSFRGRSVRITSAPTLPFLVDGELITSGEVAISVFPKHFSFVAPVSEEKTPPQFYPQA